MTTKDFFKKYNYLFRGESRKTAHDIAIDAIKKVSINEYLNENDVKVLKNYFVEDEDYERALRDLRFYIRQYVQGSLIANALNDSEVKYLYERVFNRYVYTSLELSDCHRYINTPDHIFNPNDDFLYVKEDETWTKKSIDELISDLEETCGENITFAFSDFFDDAIDFLTPLVIEAL